MATAPQEADLQFADGKSTGYTQDGPTSSKAESQTCHRNQDRNQQPRDAIASGVARGKTVPIPMPPTPQTTPFLPLPWCRARPCTYEAMPLIRRGPQLAVTHCYNVASSWWRRYRLHETETLYRRAPASSLTSSRDD